MKTKLTKVTVLAVALIMVFGCFAACGNTESTEDQTAGASVEADVSEAPTEAATTETEQETFTIGISQIVSHPSLDVCRQGALDKLAELGYVDGENLKINYQNAQNDPSVANTIAQQFVSDKVDAIMAIATPNAQAAYAVAMDEVPVVFSAVSAPAESGLAAEDGSTLKNITGTSDELPMDATFELIKALTPDTVTIGILHSTGEVNSDVQLATARELAPSYGMEIVDAGITSTNEMASALDTLLPQVDVMMNLTDNMVVSALPLVVQKCNEAMIPLFGSEDTQVVAGALASAGIDYYTLGQKTGEMMAAVLEGTPAEDIPIEYIVIESLEQSMLIINSDQVALLGITVPTEIEDSVEFVTTAQ